MARVVVAGGRGGAATSARPPSRAPRAPGEIHGLRRSFVGCSRETLEHRRICHDLSSNHRSFSCISRKIVAGFRACGGLRRSPQSARTSQGYMTRRIPSPRSTFRRSPRARRRRLKRMRAAPVATVRTHGSPAVPADPLPQVPQVHVSPQSAPARRRRLKRGAGRHSPRTSPAAQARYRSGVCAALKRGFGSHVLSHAVAQRSA